MNRKYPLVILGAGVKRWERNREDEAFGLHENDAIVREEYWNAGWLLVGVDRAAQKWGPTHLQKESWFGFLLTWPLCFHGWVQIRKQRRDSNGNYIPGSEIVFYFRTPGFRWDPEDSKFIFTKGYPPFGHWD